MERGERGPPCSHVAGRTGDATGPADEGKKSHGETVRAPPEVLAGKSLSGGNTVQHKAAHCGWHKQWRTASEASWDSAETAELVVESTSSWLRTVGLYSSSHAADT